MTSPSHSITWSARRNIDYGISMPIALLIEFGRIFHGQNPKQGGGSRAGASAHSKPNRPKFDGGQDRQNEEKKKSRSLRNQERGLSLGRRPRLQERNFHERLNYQNEHV
jgi:hypothetical protein